MIEAVCWIASGLWVLVLAFLITTVLFLVFVPVVKWVKTHFELSDSTIWLFTIAFLFTVLLCQT